MRQPDLAVRLRWLVEHDRDDLLDMLAETVPADLLHAAARRSASGSDPARPCGQQRRECAGS